MHVEFKNPLMKKKQKDQISWKDCDLVKHVELIINPSRTKIHVGDTSKKVHFSGRFCYQFQGWLNQLEIWDKNTVDILNIWTGRPIAFHKTYTLVFPWLASRSLPSYYGLYTLVLESVFQTLPLFFVVLKIIFSFFDLSDWKSLLASASSV